MGATHSVTALDRDLLQILAGVFGVVFLLVGVVGFIPGVVSSHDALEFAGTDSQAELLGIFQVSVLHNAVHILFGVAGLAMARTIPTARYFLVGGGAIYLLLWVYGLVIDKASDANFVPVNTADNWLHFGLGVAMVGSGLMLSNRTRARRLTSSASRSALAVVESRRSRQARSLPYYAGQVLGVGDVKVMPGCVALRTEAGPGTGSRSCKHTLRGYLCRM